MDDIEKVSVPNTNVRLASLMKLPVGNRRNEQGRISRELGDVKTPPRTESTFSFS